MADIYNYIEPEGVIVTDTGSILAEVGLEYQSALGSDLVVPNSEDPQAASTPQGALIISETLARSAVADNNAMLANQINPNVAGGIFLDAIMALTGIERSPATPSTIFADLNGVASTSIPAGTQIQDNSLGNIFETSGIYTIPAVQVQLNSLEDGPVPCNANTTFTILTAVLGFETVTNNTAAVLGSNTQSDIAARMYRLNTLASQGSSVALAIISAVTQVIVEDSPPAHGEPSMTFLENTMSTTQTISGVTMVRNSIYACVNGGFNGTPSTALVTVTGTPTTVIPANSQISSNGFVFFTNISNTIPGGGSLSDVAVTSVNTGPVPAPAATLTTIVTPVSGWATVTNPNPAVLGTQSDVGFALMKRKSAGAAYNNGPGVNIMTTVQEPTSGQYLTVLYDNPNAILINVIANIKVTNPVQNAQISVNNAIVNYANGGVDGIPGLVVGQNVSAFEISGAVVSQLPGVYIQSLYIAKAPTVATSSAEIAINVYEIAYVTTESITVNIIS